MAKVRCLVLMLLFCGGISSGQAQEVFPNRPLTFVVPTAASGGQDIVTRLVTPGMRKLLGQQIIVENRVGANGIIAASFVAKSKPDGHTLLVTGATQGVLHRLFYKPLPYDPEKELQAVISFAAGPNVLVVNPTLPVRNVDELVALAKRNPGQLSYASNGHGSGQHLAGELFNHLAGTQILHVPFKGSGEYLSQISGGYITMAFASTISVIPMVAAKKLKPIGVTTPERLQTMPDVPTLAENKALAGFEHVNWVGVFAPSATPAATLKILNAAAAESQRDAALITALRDRGNEVMPMDVGQVQDYVKRQSNRVAKLVAMRNIQIAP